MKTTTTVLQWWVRVVGAIMIVLGLSFWTGNLLRLIPIHMLLGITIVLALWTLAVLGVLARVPVGLVVVGFIWGLITPILGVTQDNLVPGSAHWVIQLLHLLVGLGAIGLANNLASQIKRRQSANVTAQNAGTVGEAIR
jgi:hypothetical protein